MQYGQRFIHKHVHLSVDKNWEKIRIDYPAMALLQEASRTAPALGGFPRLGLQHPALVPCYPESSIIL